MPPKKPAHSGLLQRVDFEAYKNTYRQEIQKSIDFIGQDFEFFVRKKADLLVENVQRHLGDPSKLKILDVGCGIGATDHFLVDCFKKLYGIDLSPGVIRKAATLNPKASYKAYKGGKLPYPSGSMDVAFAICVMHHVPPGEQKSFLSEMLRVLRRGGLLLIFEHNPLNPLTRLAVSRCDLDQDAYLLGLGQVSGLLKGLGAEVLLEKYIFFTPFEGALFSALDSSLGWLPLGAQYMVGARKDA